MDFRVATEARWRRFLATVDNLRFPSDPLENLLAWMQIGGLVQHIIEFS